MITDSNNSDPSSTDEHDCADHVLFNEEEVSVKEDYAIEIRGECSICGHDVVGQHILYVIFSPELDEHIFERST